MPRELPHNNEAEQALLGALLVYPEVKNVCRDEGIHTEDFFNDVHQRIYANMLEIAEEGKPIEINLLVSKLKDKDELQQCGGVEYLVSLSDSAVSGASSKYYIDLIKSKADVRRLIDVAEHITEEGFDSSTEVGAILDDAERKILEVTRTRRGLTAFRSSKEVVATVIEQLEELRNNKGEVTGVETGYKQLDFYTSGFQKGDLIILAARPSVGKTAFALNIALQASRRARIRKHNRTNGSVALFSLEMPAEQLVKRMLSAQSDVEGTKLRNGNLNDTEYGEVCEAGNVLRECAINIDDTSGAKISEIFSKCRKLKTEEGLDLVIIDYLQLISGSGSSRGQENRQQEVSEISRSLKALARELEVPVIALSQLSRSVEQRQNRTPVLSDLRESGSIEQDADVVMFLSRKDYQNVEEDQEEKDTVEVTVSIQKQRNGPTGDFQLMFKKSTNCFLSIDYQHGQDGGMNA